MPHLKLQKKKKLSAFRRIAIGTWRTVGDPSVYGSLKLKMDRALEYIEKFREKKGKRLTVTHLIGKAAARVLEEMPDANAILRFNTIYLREEIGVFYQVAMRDPETGELDLSGTVIHRANEKSLEEIIDEMEEKVKKIRAGKDKNLEGTRSSFKKIPSLLLNLAIDFISFLSYTLNLDLRWLGLPKDPFGSIMITNIGSLGLEEAYVPLVPYSRVPILLAVGEVRDEPVVEDGQIKIAKMMKICATFDHRILDGSHAAKMSKLLKEQIENPFQFFDPLD